MIVRYIMNEYDLKILKILTKRIRRGSSFAKIHLKICQLVPKMGQSSRCLNILG